MIGEVEIARAKYAKVARVAGLIDCKANIGITWFSIP
jgi:hypothetical protein